MGLLALAGMVSGAGQGLGKGLESAQSYLTQSFLQQERDKMETDRLKLQEQFAGAREQRGYAHAETLQQQKIAADEANAQLQVGGQIVGKGMDIAARESEKTSDYARLQETEQRHVTQAADLRKAVEQEERDAVKNKVQDPVYLKALKKIREANQTELEAAQIATAKFKVETQVEDRQLALDKADATTASLIFRDATNEITRLTTELNKAELSGADTTAIQQQINDAIDTQRRARAVAMNVITKGSAPEPAPSKKTSSIFTVPPEYVTKPQPATEEVGVTQKEGDAVTRDVMAREGAARSRSSGATKPRSQGEVVIEPNPKMVPEKPRRGMIDKFGDLMRKPYKPKESR